MNRIRGFFEIYKYLVMFLFKYIFIEEVVVEFICYIYSNFVNNIWF